MNYSFDMTTCPDTVQLTTKACLIEQSDGPLVIQYVKQDGSIQEYCVQLDKESVNVGGLNERFPARKLDDNAFRMFYFAGVLSIKRGNETYMFKHQPINYKSQLRG